MGIGRKILAMFGYQKSDADKAVEIDSRIRYFSYSGDWCGSGYEIIFDNLSKYAEAYKKCSPVATIINRLAESMANGKLWILDKDNNDVSEKYANIFNLLLNPNPFQTWTEFIKEIDIYRKIYGITYVYAIVPVGFNPHCSISNYK